MSALYPRWTHEMPVAVSYMAPVCEPGDRLYLRRADAPSYGADWLFVTRDGPDVLIAHVVGRVGKHWRVRQYNPGKVRRISVKKWRPVYRIVGAAFR